LFKNYDKDGNGTLDWKECKLLVTDLVKETLKTHKDRGDELNAVLEDPGTVQKLMVAFDGDGDGNVSKDEFVQKAMQGYSLPLPPQDEPPAKKRKVEAEPQSKDEHAKAYLAKKEAEEAEAQERDRVYHEKMAEVDRQHHLMVECYENASRAHGAGEFDKIKGFKAEASEHKKLKEEAREAALQFMFDRANKDSDGTWVDLHGLQVEFALTKTGEFIERSKAGGKSECNVITGAGHHSGPAGPLIKPKVWDMLKDRSLRFTEVNDGEITVHLS